MLEGPGLCFHYPAHPTEAPSPQRGLCRIYLFTRELSSEHKAEELARPMPAPGSSAGDLPQQPRETESQQECSGGPRLRITCPLYRILFGILAEPREEYGCPLARGGTGLQTTGDWPLGAAFTPGCAREILGDKMSV